MVDLHIVVTTLLTRRPVGAILRSLLLALLEIPFALLELALLLLELACPAVVVGDIGLDVLDTAARPRAGGLEAERGCVGLLAEPVVRERVGVECLAVAWVVSVRSVHVRILHDNRGVRGLPGNLALFSSPTW